MGVIDRLDRGRVVTLTLNRPERGNSLTAEGADELRNSLRDAAARAETRVIVLRGAGDVFCAGADFDLLRALVALAPEDVAELVYSVFQGLVREIVGLAVPVVAAVGGPALGAGCDLVLACDCRVVTPAARFQETWGTLGLLPGMGGMALLPPLVGLGRARAMLYRAETIGGREAVALGLAEACADDGDLDPFVARWVEPIAGMDRAVLSALKRGTRRSVLRLFGDDLDFVSSRQAMRIATVEVRQRVEALAQRSSNAGLGPDAKGSPSS